jgi:hypothetical protein
MRVPKTSKPKAPADKAKKASEVEAPPPEPSRTEATIAATTQAVAVPDEPIPAPAEHPGRAPKGAKTKPRTGATPPRLSALDAAARVLEETGQAMTCRELIGAMAAKGYWISPAGKTPHSTPYAAIARELQVKGKAARFTKAGRGTFARNGAV